MRKRSDRIRLRGEAESADGVEGDLITHLGFSVCAAIGVPGQLSEEATRLFVELKNGAELPPVSYAVIGLYVMADFRVPRDIVLVEQLPRAPTGKPDKGRAAAM